MIGDSSNLNSYSNQSHTKTLPLNIWVIYESPNMILYINEEFLES